MLQIDSARVDFIFPVRLHASRAAGTFFPHLLRFCLACGKYSFSTLRFGNHLFDVGDGVERHMAWLGEHVRDRIANSGSIDSTEKVLHFPNAPRSSDERETALDLVYQAAEVIRGVEDRANAVEARARSLAEDAVEKLQLADNRIKALEMERRAAEAYMNETSVKMQEAEKALKRAESRILAAEDQLSQAELRTRTAETRASEAEKALKRIDDAIRTHLLGHRQGVARKLSDAA